MLGELHGVPQEVAEHLPKPQRVADERRWRAGLPVQRQCETLNAGTRRDELECLPQHVIQTELDPLKLESARFNFGEV